MKLISFNLLLDTPSLVLADVVIEERKWLFWKTQITRRVFCANGMYFRFMATGALTQGSVVEDAQKAARAKLMEYATKDLMHRTQAAQGNTVEGDFTVVH